MSMRMSSSLIEMANRNYSNESFCLCASTIEALVQSVY
jgi:hypothetical protein